MRSLKLKVSLKARILTLAALFAFNSLVGCSSTSNQESFAYKLQPVAEQFVGQSWLHQITFNDKAPMLVQVEFDVNHINLVAMASSGMPIAHLTWSVENGITHHRKPMIALDWALVIQDFQLIHWPKSVIEKALSNSIRIDEHAEPLNFYSKRQFYQLDNLVIEIDRSPKVIKLINHQTNYQLVVKVLK